MPLTTSSDSPDAPEGDVSPDQSPSVSSSNAQAHDHGRGAALALFEGEHSDSDSERDGFEPQDQDRHERNRPEGGHQPSGAGALEVADEASIRDFYAQLVGLLTQENAARAPVKKSRAGLKEAIRRRFWPALLLFLLSLGALGLLLRPRSASYSSSVVLLLPPKENPGSADPLGSSEQLYDAGAQIGIIGSETIVRDAMMHVPPDLRARGFGDRNAIVAPVDVSPAGSDSLVSITVSSADPRASLALANAMVDAYTRHTRNRFGQNRNDNLRVTSKTVNDAAKRLAAARQGVRRLKEQNGIVDLTSAQSSSSSNINALQSALDAERRSALGATTNDATLLSLQQAVQQKEVAFQTVMRNFFPDAPNVRAARSELEAARAQVNARQAQIMRESDQRIAQLEESLSRARAQAQNLPAIEQRLNQLNERVQTEEQAFRAANERLNQLRLAREAVAPVATRLRAPGVSSSQTMQKARAAFVALLGALALATLGAWLLDRADKSVRTAPDPETLFGAPVLGALPASDEHRTFYLAPTSSNKGNARSRTQTIEACTNAQHNILAAATAAGARSILLTSALPEEGKSGCASNLAAAMAYGGREVLLIDADFWHPSQHSNFDMELSPGYAQVLRDKLPLSEAIRPSPVANLFLLSTGQDSSTPGDVVGLLQGRMHRQNMELLKKYFDIIVIDAPPTMTVADAQLLSSLADAVVLVTAEKTRRDEVQRARSMLRLAGAYILGVVVNSVRPGEVGGWNLNFSGEEPFAEYSQSLRVRGRGH